MAASPDDPISAAGISARLVKDYAEDRQMFLELLAAALTEAGGEQLRIKRGGGWLSRKRPIESLDFELDDDRFSLSIGRGGALEATRTHIVRGIALRTEELSVESWLAALSEALFQFGQTHAGALEALRRRLW